MKSICLVIIFLSQITCTSFAQSKLNFDSLITANASTFHANGGQFSGKAWERMLDRARATNYVLIGEDHFFSEVPLFTQALIENALIDNYICEIDQWMLDVFKSKINTLTEAQLDAWITDNYNGFSFFQKKNEFELIRYLCKMKVNLMGIEQVGLMSTTIIFQYLVENGSQQNKRYYELLRDSSAVVNNRFFLDHTRPFFLSTPFFMATMKNLRKEHMNKDEAALTNALIKSAEIYETGSHRKRIRLMQANLMNRYPQALKGKRNLFKFGANHVMKGESYLPVIDIGTTAHIMAQAEDMDSYHILILPKAGDQAGFLGGSSPVSMNDEPYASLQRFFALSSNSDWTCINLEAIRNEIRKQALIIGNPTLEKTLKGYDVLVVIPAATAAKAVR